MGGHGLPNKKLRPDEDPIDQKTLFPLVLAVILNVETNSNIIICFLALNQHYLLIRYM
jgi:hypothetical protein